MIFPSGRHVTGTLDENKKICRHEFRAGSYPGRLYEAMLYSWTVAMFRSIFTNKREIKSREHRSVQCVSWQD